MSLILNEVRALRSELSAVKSKQTEIIRVQNNSSSLPRDIIPDNIPSPVRINIRSQPQFVGNHAPRFAETEDSSNAIPIEQQPIHVQGRDVISLEDDPPLNPFIPPPIKNVLLRKIEKRDFIDLEDLLPVSTNVSKQSHDTPYIDIDTESSALRLRQGEKKAKINNVASWMSAWNVYMQAYLHFRPNMFYEFFSY